MSDLTPARNDGAAIGLDHVGIVGADLDELARAFSGLGFNLTSRATHASGRTANHCVMLRDGGYMELIATVPGQSSATMDRFLAAGPGAHILALEVGNEAPVLDRLRRAGGTPEASITERDASQPGAKARFALIMPPDQPESRMLLIRHLTRDLLWRPDNVIHPNGAVALTEAVFATDSPAGTMTRLSLLSGRPAEPDPMGGYRIPLARGCVRILPRAAAIKLFPGEAGTLPLIGLTIATDQPEDATSGQNAHAGGVAIRFIAMPD
jgi:hypothetical protein